MEIFKVFRAIDVVKGGQQGTGTVGCLGSGNGLLQNIGSTPWSVSQEGGKV